MKTCSLLCVLAILVTPDSSASELPELLIPVTGQAEQQVREKQGYFLKKHTYFAKRHRIVRVDTDVLFNEPTFRITFFDDASVIVRRDEFEYRGTEKSRFIWKGHMEGQGIALEDFLTEGNSPERARIEYSALVEVWIAGAKQVYHPETGTSSSLVGLDAKTMKPINSVDPSKGEYEFYDIGTEIAPLSLSATFRLHSLDPDKRYLIVMEVDPAKLLSPGHFGGPKDATEAAFRKLQYEQYLEFLGPDPRRATDQQE